ncbi:CYTH domain-containing protein [Salana multivorans]
MERKDPSPSLESLADATDFEYERRFLVTHFPAALRDAPALIVQSYYLADAGYAMRVRVQANDVESNLTSASRPLEVLDRYRDQATLATVTVKGPSIGGTRYESERHVDADVAVELIRRGGMPMVKTRYSVWAGSDGWAVDVFGGANHPLVVAECERSGPVTDLEIPAWCVTELTDDRRFSNESLASRPYGEWASSYLAELSAQGPRMRGDFGTNAQLLPE